MELVKYLNESFWKSSGYMVVFFVAMIYIFLKNHKQSRGFLMAFYTLLCFFLVVYNPVIANLAVAYFMEDASAYLRIFYLLPIMSILAYVATEFYCENVKKMDRTSQKVKFVVIICMAFVLAGGFFDEKMFVRAENIYKIDSEALEIADFILNDSGETQTRCIFQKDDNLIAGIRQYTDKIVIADTVETIKTADEIYTFQSRDMFQYIIIEKKEQSVRILETVGYSCAEETEQHYIYRKGGY